MKKKNSWEGKKKKFHFKILKNIALPILLGLIYFIVILTILSKNSIFIFNAEKN